MAAILSLGYKLPMAQYFLGNLYFRLDEIHTASERSGGRYDIGSYVHGSFLTMFLYERFKGFGPKVQDISFDKDEVPIRIERWHDALGMDNLSFYIDNEEDFIFRPYCSSTPYWSYPFFEEDDWVYEHPTGLVNNWLSDMKGGTLVVAFSSFLPYLTDDGEGHVRYNPHRCWRQLGFDQVVPIEYFDGEIENNAANKLAWSFHTRKAFYRICDRYHEQDMPSAGRKAKSSEQWYLFWARQTQLFLQYVDSTPEVPDFPVISTVSDAVLRKQKPKEQNWRGSLSSYVKTVEEKPSKKSQSPLKKKTVVPSTPPVVSKKTLPSRSPIKKNLPPPPPTKTRTTRAAAKKRSRDEDLSNFVAIEEETAHSKRRKALEVVKQAKKGKAQISEEGTPTFISLNHYFMLY